MKYSMAIFYLLAYWTTCSSFAIHIPSRHSQLEASSSSSNTADDRPKNLVDIKTFTAAVQALQGEGSNKEEEEDQPMYAIGKLKVELSFVGTPGLDLAEAPGLVLVSGVSGNAAEVGVLKGDTIVSIGAAGGTFHQETKGLTLEETASILMAAATHAIENGLAEVELEINRLIKMAYSN